MILQIVGAQYCVYLCFVFASNDTFDFVLPHASKVIV